MPSYVLNDYDLTVTHTAAEANLAYRVNVNTAAVDTLEYDLTVTRGLATIVASPWYRCGAVLELDLGDGNLTAIAPANLGSDLSISESFDGFADTLNFTLVGQDWSPWTKAAIRSRLRCRVTATLAAGSNRQSRVIFDGYIQSASFSAAGTASVTALDGAGAYVGQQLHINIGPNSNFTREYIILTYVTTPLGIPVGRINLGADGGGRVIKAVSVSGTDALDWLREFVAPCGAQVWCVDRALYIEKLRPATEPARTLTAIDMADDLDVTVPPTNNANIIVATGVVSPYADADKGLVTKVTTSSPPGSYTPKAAVQKQSKTDGTVSAYAPSVSAADKASETITTQSYLGGSLVYERIETWGWYALLGARYKQDNLGAVSWNPDNDVYEYADGSWRSEPVEVWRKLSESWRTIEYDPVTGYQSSETTRGRLLHYVPAGAYAQVTGTGPITLSYLTSYVTHTGESWTAASEVLVDPLSGTWTPNDTDYATETMEADDDGFLKRSYRTGYENGRLSVRPAVNVYAYHPEAEQTTYTLTSAAVSRNAVTREAVWTKTSEATARVIETTTYAVQIGAMVNGTRVYDTGLPPRLPQLLWRQPPQLVRTTMTDAVSVALTGSHYYYIHDESAETTSELGVIAFEELRKQGAWTLSWSQPYDATLHKGSTVRLSRPEIGLSDDAIVWSVDSTIGSGGAATSRVVAYFYPPEIS